MNNLEIGATVKSKNGQINAEGTLVAIFHPEFYVQFMVPKDTKFPVWDETCKNWKQELIGLVYFKDPQKTIPLQEWIKTGLEAGISQEECEANYLAKCPKTQTMTFPWADLEQVG